MTYFGNRCYFCHSSMATATGHAARPLGAGDAHGYNTRAAGGAFPAGSGYAFIRTEGWYSNASYYQRVRSVGATTYTSACTGFAGACSRSSMGNYTPGGVY